MISDIMLDQATVLVIFDSIVRLTMKKNITKLSSLAALQILCSKRRPVYYAW